MVAIRWYLRYSLSYRDVEELLAERGIEVDRVTIYRWVQRFTPMLIGCGPALPSTEQPRTSDYRRTQPGQPAGVGDPLADCSVRSD